MSTLQKLGPVSAALCTNPIKRRAALMLAVAAVVSGSLYNSAHAAPATWNSTATNGNWEAAGAENNWSTGVATFPGALNDLANPDTATFLTSSTTTIAINAAATNSSPLGINSIAFGAVASPSAFTIGTVAGNSLLLASGGSVFISSGVSGTGKTETINAPIVLEPLTATSAGTYTFSNASTVAASILNFGGTITGGTTTQGITLTLTGTSTSANSISGIISDGAATLGLGITKTGTGTWNLSAANSYTGATTISAGTLTLATKNGSLSTSSAIGMGGGTLNFDNTGTAAALTPSVGSLTFSSGDSTVKMTRTAAFDQLITFASLGTRTAGATGNFVLAGTASSTNKFALTSTAGAPLDTGSNDPGLFFGGSSYARYDTTNNNFRAVIYGTDTNANAPLTGAQTTLGTIGSTIDAQYVGSTSTASTVNTVSSASTTLVVGNGGLFTVGQALTGTGIAANTWVTAISGNTLTLSQVATVAANATITPYNSVSAQTTDSLNTLNLSGTGASLTLAASQTLTVNGILRSGGGTFGVISGGSGIQAANNAEMVVRADTASDNLTIATAILANGTSRLTTSGAGTITLSSNNTFTGPLVVDGGTLNINGSNATSGVTILGGTVMLGANASALGANAVNLGGGSGGVTLVSIQAVNFANAIVVNPTSAGTLFLSGQNTTYSGPITLNNDLTINVYSSNSNRSQTVSGPITGSKTISTSGNNSPGTGYNVLISGPNTGFTGNVNIIKNTLFFGLNSLGLTTSPGTISFTGTAPTLGWVSGNTQDLSNRFSPLATTAGFDTNGNNVTFNSGLSGTAGITKWGGGTLTLAASNTYAGNTTVSGGTLQFAKEAALYNNVTANWIATKITVASGTTLALNVGGTGEFTSADVATLAAMGTTTTNGFATGSILGLDTTNAGGNFAYSNVIANPNAGVNVLGLTKLGTGSLTLSNSHTYTGPTAVNGGTLVLASGANLASSGVTVNNAGSTLAVTPGVAGTTALGGTLTLNSGTNFTMADGATSTASITGAGSLAPATGAGVVSPTLTFNIGGVATATDVLAISLAGTVGTAKASIAFTGFGSTALTAGPYNFITAGSALTPANFTLLTPNVAVNGVVYGLALSGSATAETVTASNTPNSVGVAFWTGSQDGSWKTQTPVTLNTNFSNDALGTFNTFALPDLNTNVTFTANSATNLATTLDQNFTINSLTFSGTGTSNTAGSTIAPGGAFALTINAAPLNLNPAGNGITVSATSGPNTISAAVVLGATQTWTVNGPLTVSGNISQVSTGLGLTKAGTGTLVLSGTNSYTGGTGLSGTGVLQLVATPSNTSGGVSSAWAPSSILTMTAAATGPTLQLRADGSTTFGGSGLNVTAGAAATIDIDRIPTGSLTGQTITIGGATVINGATATQVNVTGANGYILTLGSLGLNTATVTFNVNNTTLTTGAIFAGAGSPVTNGVTFGSGGASVSFTGNGTVNVASETWNQTSRAYALTVNGPTVNLNGLNTGALSLTQGATNFNLNSGTLNVNIATAFGPGTSTHFHNLNLAGGTIDTTAGGLTVTAGTLLTNINNNFTFGGSNPLNLGTGGYSLGATAGTRTITTNASTLTFDGGVADGGEGVWVPGTGGTTAPSLSSLVKSGPGTLVLNKTNFYTGTTTVSQGTLLVNGDAVAAQSAITGATTVNTNTITGIASGVVANLRVGQIVTGTNIPAGSIILSKPSATSVLFSTVSSATGSATNLAFNAGSATGAGNVSVGVSGTLGGSGTITGAVTNNGRIAPGNSPGILTVNNNVTFNDGSTLSSQIFGNTPGNTASNYDQLVVGGSGVLAMSGTNNLELDLGSFTPTVGDQYTIVLQQGTANGITNYFDQLNGVTTSLNQGDTFNLGAYSFQISYQAEGTTFDMGAGNGNDIMLQAVTPVGVPEPTSLGLLALGATALLARRRRSV